MRRVHECSCLWTIVDVLSDFNSNIGIVRQSGGLFQVTFSLVHALVIFPFSLTFVPRKGILAGRG